MQSFIGVGRTNSRIYSLPRCNMRRLRHLCSSRNQLNSLDLGGQSWFSRFHTIKIIQSDRGQHFNTIIAVNMKPQLSVPSFLENTYLFELITRISQIKGDYILLQDTIFHPQGGGQPKDKGYILHDESKIDILDASSDRQSGQIWYRVEGVNALKPGDQITMRIDENVRRTNAKLHSAGHLIDLAVHNLKLEWQTNKGYHFEDNPYVEYKGVLGDSQGSRNAINDQLKEILNSQIVTQKQYYSYEQAIEKGLVPKEFKTPVVRIIKFGDSSCPCGGTHVNGVKDFEAISVTKLQKKGKNIKAYYKVV